MRRIAWLHAAFLATSLLATSVVCASETISYTYDAKGRVTRVVHTGTVNNGVQSSYAHDKADNRIKVTTTGASSSTPN